MKTSDYNEERIILQHWASSDSAGFAAIAWDNAVTAAPETSAVFTVDLGRARTTIYANGSTQVDVNAEELVTNVDEELITVKAGKPRYNPVGVHIESGIPPGSVPTNKMIGAMRIPCGIVLIVAGGSTGKTPLAHLLAGHGDSDYGVVRYGEPIAGYASDETSGCDWLAKSLSTYHDVVFDSVKDVLALAQGGAMKAGISRGSLPLLSRWGALAASMGRTLYVPVNPSSPDTEVVELLVEAAKSNATCAIFEKGPDMWGYLTRRGEGLEREKGTFRTKYSQSGAMEIIGIETEQQDSQLYGPLSMGNQTKLSDDKYNDVLRRSTGLF